MKIKSCIETGNIKACGPYSPALKASDFIFVSAQLPIDPKTDKLVSDDIQIQTRECMDHIRSLLKEAGLEMHYIVKTTIFLTDEKFLGQVDKIYASYFEDTYPARTVCLLNALEYGASIKIECTALDYRCLEVLCGEECCDEECCGIE